MLTVIRAEILLGNQGYSQLPSKVSGEQINIFIHHSASHLMTMHNKYLETKRASRSIGIISL